MTPTTMDPAARTRARKARLIMAAFAAVVAVAIGAYIVQHAGSDARARQAGRVPYDARVERDEIFTLLAYSVAFKDWQEEGPDRRGYNVGAVLVDPSGTNVVFWARNCGGRLRNATQHAELRLMLGYLDTTRIYNLKGHTVYATLEPCAQCAGMMTMLDVRRVVYGQADPEFGKALERLQLHTRGRLRPWHGRRDRGYAPYPRAVVAHKSRSVFAGRLEEAYGRSGADMPDFLCSEAARAIFAEARQALDTYSVRHAVNESALLSARKMLESVPEDYVPLGLDL